MGPYNFLRPEDEAEGDYPTVLMDSENKTVLSIDSDELYFYIGQLLVTFDDDGNVESWDTRSGPIATTAEAVDLLTVELGLNTTLEPIPTVRETLDLLQSTPSIQQAFQVIGNTTTPLNGVRASVRTRETNRKYTSSYYGTRAYTCLLTQLSFRFDCCFLFASIYSWPCGSRQYSLGRQRILRGQWIARD